MDPQGPMPGLEAVAWCLLEPPGEALAMRLREEAGAHWAAGDETVWKQDFDRLFLLPHSGRILPLESAYRARVRLPDGTVRWERPDPEVLGRIRALYAHFDFQMPERFAHHPDHAGVELMFLLGLSFQQEAAQMAGDEALATGLARWQRVFLDDHLRGWIPDLAEDLVAGARTDLYREVGRLLSQAVSRTSGR